MAPGEGKWENLQSPASVPQTCPSLCLLLLSLSVYLPCTHCTYVEWILTLTLWMGGTQSQARTDKVGYQLSVCWLVLRSSLFPAPPLSTGQEASHLPNPLLHPTPSPPPQHDFLPELRRAPVLSSSLPGPRRYLYMFVVGDNKGKLLCLPLEISLGNSRWGFKQNLFASSLLQQTTPQCLIVGKNMGCPWHSSPEWSDENPRKGLFLPQPTYLSYMA